MVTFSLRLSTVALSGAIVVTTPQELRSSMLRKARYHVQKVNVPVLGIIENMIISPLRPTANASIFLAVWRERERNRLASMAWPNSDRYPHAGIGGPRDSDCRKDASFYRIKPSS